jgi:uncharacterized protein (DUF362 family)
MGENLSRRAVLQAAPAALLLPGSHERAIENAVERAGGLPAVPRGGLVVLKVNSNSGDPAPYSSSPTLVRWVASAYVKQGARVLVGDRSFWGDTDTAGNLVRNGIAPAARAAGATCIAFEHDTVEWKELRPEALPTWVAPVRVPKAVFEASAVINLACAKTHFITGVTLGLKNALGFVHADDRARDGNLRVHRRERIHRQTAELHRALPFSFTIIDGFDALVTGGPTPTSGAPPTLVRTGLVLASRDAHAVEQEGRALLASWAP